MSLGLLSRFYSNLRAYKVRRLIAGSYGLDESFLEGFMEHLSYVRNVCAHHSRLWNRHLSKKMPLPKGKPAGLKDRINKNAEHKLYNTLLLIQHFMQIISPKSLWQERIIQLINKYNVDVEKMGFPENWREVF
jgi:abortive infection bacteriophage resistance protein